MRDRSSWHSKPSSQLRPHWPETIKGFTRGDLLDVELGLYLLELVMPTRRAIDAWTLLGGYPYAEAFGEARTEQQRLAIRRARHYLWDLRRRYAWQQAINAYCRVPEHLRGYILGDETEVPQRRRPTHASDRFALYETLLSTPPAFETKPLPTADVGEHWFPVRDRRYAVTFTEDIVGHVIPAHDIDALPPGEGKPLEVGWAELEDAARVMDEREVSLPDHQRNHWTARLARVRLLVRDEVKGAFVADRPLRIDALLHLVGMVGAGKSTLRDVLTFWAAEIKQLNITIVVGDVAEELAVVGTFRNLNVTATPIIGHSTRERHIQRLHRRLASGSAGSMLAHRHHGFAYLSSACPLDALRGLDGPRPLRISEAPCGMLFPVDRQDQPEESPLETITGAMLPVVSSTPERRSAPEPHGCPLWAQCPRQHGAHQLVSSRIWVANPASLVHSGIPRQQHRERMRYLELATRRSDLIIIDEADRVQMLLDTAFAPTATLVGRSPDSWLDEVAAKSIEALSRQGRAQLSEHTVNLWMAALDTVTAATNRLYAMLLSEDNRALLDWITEDYFSALTLHQWLMSSWFPELSESADPAVDEADPAAVHRAELRQHVSEVLNRFRDTPLRTSGDTGRVSRKIDELVNLTLELLHSPDMGRTGTRVREALLDLLGGELLADGGAPHDVDIELNVTRFEFTLLLAALHHDLDVMTMLWPTVEPALDLDSASNVLSRRPPKDYEPIIPESPMGNVLGFQFHLDDRGRGAQRSGELRFFRCSGVGRELLLSLGSFAAIDGRPAAHVLLMSATSWSGTSTRYHLHAPVGAVLRPNDDEVNAILGTTFRKEFLSWPPDSGRAPDPNAGTTRALRLSGTDPQQRPHVLREMLRQLAEPDRSLTGAKSRFDVELDELGEIDSDRRRILVLTGSYSEAKTAYDYLNTIPEWNGRVMRLVPDDADLDDAWHGLHRGDLTTFPTYGADILIAPLLAVERGHNIVVPGSGGKAAIGTVYFLARPHHRPDDMTLAIQAVNDWAVRQVRYGAFHQQALASGNPDRGGLDFRKLAAGRWNHFLTRRMSWTSLNAEEKTAFTWDQLVLIWQVTGRLVRGGVPARVVFVDAAFSPREAGFTGTDTPATSLLASMREVLEPYFSPTSPLPNIDKSLVHALYEPLYKALASMDD